MIFSGFKSKWTTNRLCKCRIPSNICLINAEADASSKYSWAHTWSNSSPPETLKSCTVAPQANENDIQLEHQNNIVWRLKDIMKLDDILVSSDIPQNFDLSFDVIPGHSASRGRVSALFNKFSRILFARLSAGNFMDHSELSTAQLIADFVTILEWSFVHFESRWRRGDNFSGSRLGFQGTQRSNHSSFLLWISLSEEWKGTNEFTRSFRGKLNEHENEVKDLETSNIYFKIYQIFCSDSRNWVIERNRATLDFKTEKIGVIATVDGVEGGTKTSWIERDFSREKT